MAVTAKAVDEAGNVSSASDALTITIDTVAPNAPPQPDLDSNSDSGTSNSDNLTNDTTPTLVGTAEANSKVEIFNGSSSLGTVQAHPTTGDWSFTVSTALGDGNHSFTAKPFDVAGNALAASPNLSITIDASAPAVPSIPDLVPSSDTGSSNEDNITGDTTPSFTGTADADITIELFAGSTSLGTTTADDDGNWNFTVENDLPIGSHSIRSKSADAAGNQSTLSNSLNINILPLIDSATYNTSTGVLQVSGSGFVSKSGPANDIDVSKLLITGEGGSSYTLTSSDVEVSSSTQFSVTLNSADQLNVGSLLNKNGTISDGGTSYKLSAVDDWVAGATASVDISVFTGLGSALDLDGSDDYVSVPSSSALDFGVSDPFTFEAWVNLDGTGESEQNILSKGDDQTGVAFRWGIYTSGTFFMWNNNHHIYLNGVFNDHWNEWTHVAASSDGSTLKMYVNGEESFSGSWQLNQTSALSGAELTIGTDSHGRYINGQIADVRIWNVARSTDEINSNYRRRVDPSSAGMIANYLFESDQQVVNSSSDQNKLPNGSYLNGASAVQLSDESSNGITVSNVANPTLSSAAYDAASGELTVTGTNFVRKDGSSNDIDVSKLSITGDGGSSYTLQMRI